MRTEFIYSLSAISVTEFGTTCKSNGLAMDLWIFSTLSLRLEKALDTLSSWRF
jgi:hypothetical protein